MYNVLFRQGPVAYIKWIKFLTWLDLNMSLNQSFISDFSEYLLKELKIKYKQH